MQRLLYCVLPCFLSFAANAISVSISVQGLPVCSYSNGYLAAYVNGGIPPYTYQWSNGETTDAIYGIPAGTYSVTVTDANNDQAGAQIVLTSNQMPNAYVNWLPGCPDGISAYLFMDLEHYYHTPMTFTVNDPQFGTAYLESFANPDQPSNTVRLNGTNLFPGQQLDLTLTDENGCTFNTWGPTIVPPPFEWMDDLQIMEVKGACSNGLNGSVRVFVPSHHWSAHMSITLGGQTIAGYSGEHVFHSLAPGTYHIVNRIYWNGVAPWLIDNYSYVHEYCGDTIATVVVPDLGSTCGTVSGRLFIDVNGNCVQNSPSVEPGIPNTVLEFQPGDHFTMTNNTGNYSINLPIGTYTVTQHALEYAATCDAETTPIVISGGTPFITRNIPTVSLQGLDLRIGMSSGPARPGFELHYGISVRNLTGTASGAGTVTMTFDPTLGFLSANPAPESVSGNIITWTTTSLTAFQSRHFTVNFQVPPDVTLLGTELTATATVTSTITDVVPGNNSTTHTVTVTGSYDPNDKLAHTNSGTNADYAIGEDAWIDYTIRFQNTGTDTAFLVVITDTLSTLLDPATFQLGTSSHAYSMTMNDRVLRFMFPNILLPDSNVNEPKSHGFVKFRIKPVEGIQPGDQLINIANIYFDHNPPVITDPSVLLATVPPVKVAVKTMLGGPFISGTGLMNDALRAAGDIPHIEPYTSMGFMHVEGGGGESIMHGVLAVTGPGAIVDWVVIELRNASNPAQVLNTRSALIRRDGQVVDVDGVSPVAFNAFEGNYRIAIKHRNHLGAMTASPVALSFTPAIVDLTSGLTATHGSSGRNNINGTMVLWPGDANFDGVVKYSGQDNDRDLVLVAIGGVIPTNTVPSGYTGMDVNMNGITKYTGELNDRDVILQTIGGVVPTAVRVEQVP